MSLHSPTGVVGWPISVSGQHVYKTLMNTDYETARLMLEDKPMVTRFGRVNQYLAYQVNGRTLEGLRDDYLELATGMEGEAKKQLEDSYLVGWSHHDAVGMLDWVAENVADEVRRKRIYTRALMNDTNKILNEMLARRGKREYDEMMRVVADNYEKLTPRQAQMFEQANTTLAAERIVFINPMDRGWMQNSTLGYEPILKQLPEGVLVIPRP